MQPAPPCPVPARKWQMRVCGLLRWELQLGAYSAGFFVCLFSSWLCCLLRLQDSPQTLQWEGFLLFGNFLLTPSPGWVSVPKSFVSLFVFYILSYLLSKRMGCLSVCLVSSESIQKLFCGVCSAFKRSFDEFGGGESGLPILFLHHLRTASPVPMFLYIIVLSLSLSLTFSLSICAFFVTSDWIPSIYSSLNISLQIPICFLDGC